MVELHTRVLSAKARGAPHAKAQVYLAEGRLMVLELMGYLTGFYRDATFGLLDGQPQALVRKGKVPGDG